MTLKYVLPLARKVSVATNNAFAIKVTGVKLVVKLNAWANWPGRLGAVVTACVGMMVYVIAMETLILPRVAPLSGVLKTVQVMEYAKQTVFVNA